MGAPTAAKLDLKYATASELIKAERGRTSWSEEKRVSEIDENQIALVAAVRRLSAVGASILLDGHFALLGKDGRIARLQATVFRDLGVTGVVLLEECSDEILARLKERSNVSMDLVRLTELQSAEIETAIAVCTELNIPLIRLVSTTEVRLVEAIRSLMRPGVGGLEN